MSFGPFLLLHEADNVLVARAHAPEGLVVTLEDGEAMLSRPIPMAHKIARRAIAAGDLTASLQALAALKAPVDAFFDGVMVNAEDAALKANRQRAYDDFAAVAEDLAKRRVTSPRHLGIIGGSNGGLLVGACLTQRPDLFGATLPAVGVMDMLRFPLFTEGRTWTDPKVIQVENFLYATSQLAQTTLRAVLGKHRSRIGGRCRHSERHHGAVRSGQRHILDRIDQTSHQRLVIDPISAQQHQPLRISRIAHHTETRQLPLQPQLRRQTPHPQIRLADDDARHAACRRFSGAHRARPGPDGESFFGIIKG